MTPPKTHQELREAFLRYFEAHGHRRVASAGLIPQSDPTLLFTNAGMVPFKKYFLAEETPEYRRAVSSQKCVRAGGKHNDLENVGYTARHHTFFEMLGNFSFGDYFKRDAIHYAWNFVTRVLGLAPDRLVVTVFAGEGDLPSDDEAAALWAAQGVPDERIIRLGLKDNFWAMGDTGPCGPCSEIHFYRGQLDPTAALKIFATPAAEDQWIEIWNLVFMQFNRDSAGVMHPLPNPSIDTGMGLERLCAVIQNVETNYDTDLFAPILRSISHIVGRPYRSDGETDVAMRVIADHARATAFLIADGVLPDHEGRGYVLRRIMRRAIRYGRKVGVRRPFLADVCAVVAAEMQAVYPELAAHADTVRRVVTLEEERFSETLERGLALFQSALENVRAEKRERIPGEVVFRLYDTYGFPIDLTALLAREAGVGIDEQGFAAAMEEQRQRARAADHFSAAAHGTAFTELAATHFLGYTALEAPAVIVAIARAGKALDVADAGSECDVVLDRTPFYAAGGGQVGDRGEIRGPQGRARVVDVTKTPGGVFVHRVRVEQGRIGRDEQVTAAVDRSWRLPAAAHHTATHMLQAALRETLGSHVRQAGSLVEPTRLRFDFSHFASLRPEERLQVENRVNEKIQENLNVTTREMSYDEAIARGALAFFGDKYGDRVRVVEIPGFSVELCGGTHVPATGNIGVWLIDSEGSVSAGVRRIEAVVGDAAVARVRRIEHDLDAVATRIGVHRKDLVKHIDLLLETAQVQSRELASLRAKLAGTAAKDLRSQTQTVGPWRVLAAEVAAQTVDDLKRLADELRGPEPDLTVFLVSREGEVPSLFASVPEALVRELHAGNLLKAAAAAMGARGGGKPASAQGGGGDPAKAPDAVAAFVDAVRAAAARRN